MVYNKTLDYAVHQGAVAEVLFSLSFHLNCAYHHYFFQSSFNQHYHLPSWSYRDLIWSNYDGANPTMMNYIRFKNNIRAHHPPWFVHLFIADTLAALIAEVAQRCEHSPAVTYPRSQKPPPLRKNLFTSRCSKSMPALIDLYAHHVNIGVLKAGNVSISPLGSWKLIQDRPTKFGEY